MNAGRFFERVAGVAVRWPWLVIVPIVALTGAGIFAATRLDTNAGTDTLVSKGSSEFQATQDFHQKFGDEPVIVLAKEDLRKLVLTKDLEPLFELEECFAGGTQLAAGASPQDEGAAARRSATGSPSSTRATPSSGPATFLYLSVAGIQQALQGQIGGAAQQARAAGDQARRAAAKRGASAAEQQQAANAAAQQVLGQFQGGLIQVAIQYGLTSIPRLDDPNFVSRVVFDESKPAGHAEGALRLPLPEPERGPDHRAPPPRPDRRRAARGDRALQAGGRGPALQAQRRQLRRHRRPGRGRRRRAGAPQPDAAAARASRAW